MCSNDSIPLSETCECNTYEYYMNNSCHSCNLECSACTNNSTCETCITNNSSPAEFGCKCNEHYYSNTSLIEFNSCIPCGSKCSSCDLTGFCLGCYDINADPSDNCNCKRGYFLLDICVACYPECSSCIEYGMCESCISINAVPISFGCKCVTGYGSSSQLLFEDSCIKCNDDCLTCNEINECLICKDINSIPISKGCACKDTYYKSDVNICINCPKDCKTCNSTNCIDCLSINALPDINSCYCPIGTFQIFNSSDYIECRKCNSDCISCNNADTCIDCKIIGAIPSTIGCQCEDKYYDNSIECIECNNWDSILNECIFCNGNEYYNNNTCNACPSLCKSCDENQCYECIQHAELVNNYCNCSLYYKGTTHCILEDLTLMISVPDNNILLTFSQPLNEPLSSSWISLSIPNIFFSYNITQWSLSQYYIEIIYESALTSNISLTLTILKPIISQLNNTLEKTIYLIQQFGLSINTIAIENEYESQGTAIIVCFASLSLLLSILNFNLISLWSFLNMIQLLIFIRLTNNYMPPKLNAVLIAFKKIDLIPNLMSYFISSNSLSSPNIIACNFGFNSVNVLLNIGSYITILLVILANMAIVMIFYRFRSRKLFSYEIIKTTLISLMGSFKYNAFIRYFIQYYIEFAVCAMIAITNASIISIAQLANYIFAIIIMIVIVLTPLAAGFIINHYKIEIMANNKQLTSKYSSLFYEFSNDHGLFITLFYVFFFIRRLLFVIILFAFQQYPLLQIILSYLLSVTVRTI